MSSEIVVVREVGVGETVQAGSLAGVIGGLLLAVWAMGAAVVNGMDPLAPVRMIGATFIGASALDGGAPIILYGLIVHLVTAMAAGVLFAAILPRDASTRAALVSGLIYGLLVMLVMLYLVMPIVNPVMREGVEPTMTAFTIQHLLYGASLALVPTLRRRFAHL